MRIESQHTLTGPQTERSHEWLPPLRPYHDYRVPHEWHDELVPSPEWHMRQRPTSAVSGLVQLDHWNGWPCKFVSQIRPHSGSCRCVSHFADTHAIPTTAIGLIPCERIRPISEMTNLSKSETDISRRSSDSERLLHIVRRFWLIGDLQRTEWTVNLDMRECGCVRWNTFVQFGEQCRCILIGFVNIILVERIQTNGRQIRHFFSFEIVIFVYVLSSASCGAKWRFRNIVTTGCDIWCHLWQFERSVCACDGHADVYSLSTQEQRWNVRNTRVRLHIVEMFLWNFNSI